MSAWNNYVEYNYCGIVGGSGNTVNNILYFNESFFSGGTFRRKGNPYLNFMALFEDENDNCRDAVVKRLDEAYASKHFPLLIEITELADICARIVYFSGGPDDEAVRQLINTFFTFSCIPLGFQYQAQIVRVGSDYFFEMEPQK